MCLTERNSINIPKNTTDFLQAFFERDIEK